MKFSIKGFSIKDFFTYTEVQCQGVVCGWLGLSQGERMSIVALRIAHVKHSKWQI